MYLESNTPSAVIKDQAHCLTKDLEKWLKKNKPTVIPPGVSLGEVKFVDNSKVKRDMEQEKKAKYNSAKQTPEQKAKFERQTKNKGLMVAAVESGFMRFDGICDKHGISKFVINKKAKQYPNTYPFQYKCHKCKYEYAAELKKKRREVAKSK